MPSVNNAVLNKYTTPSFYQLNAQVRYKFTGFLHGSQVDPQYMYKGNMTANLEEIPANYHNKVDTHNISMVLNYYFFRLLSKNKLYSLALEVV